MTETLLNELEKACDTATRGPWFICDHEVKWTDVGFTDDEGYVHLVTESVCQGDAEFMVLARSALPILVAEIRRLRGAELPTPKYGFRVPGR